MNEVVKEVVDQQQQVAAWASLLKTFAKSKSLSQGRLLHARIRQHGCHRHTFLANCLLQMYGNCGSIPEARAAFDAMLHPNLCSWNMLIKAYGQNGNVQDALCAFSQMPHRDVISWTAIISVLAQNHHCKEALNLFLQMQLEGMAPNKVTLTCVLHACSSLPALQQGKQIHAAIIDIGLEQDTVVGTGLVKMYGKCASLCKAWTVFSKIPHRDVVAWNAMLGAFAQNGDLNRAQQIFDSMSQRDLVSWNIMIVAFTQNGQGKDAMDFFHQMQAEGITPNKITFVGILNACAGLASFKDGETIHSTIIDFGFDRDVVVGNALVNMYGKCGSLCDARHVFGKILHSNVVSWTTMIVACAQNGNDKEALDLFHQMQVENIKPDKVAFICVVNACASMAALDDGKDIHAAIVTVGSEDDLVVGTALIHMYGKCGSLPESRCVFGRLPDRNVPSWNAMMTALGQSGHVEETIELFHKMQVESITPDSVSFSCVLNACSHAGWVDDARTFFVFMEKDHGISNTEEHYTCMIDLLGRAGHLDEAEVLVNNIPYDAALAWLCLLSACKVHGDVVRAMRAANHCFELDPINVAPYVMLSNILAAAGAWKLVVKLKNALRTIIMKQKVEWSCVEIGKGEYELVAGEYTTFSD